MTLKVLNLLPLTRVSHMKSMAHSSFRTRGIILGLAGLFFIRFRGFCGRENPSRTYTRRILLAPKFGYTFWTFRMILLRPLPVEPIAACLASFATKSFAGSFFLSHSRLRGQIIFLHPSRTRTPCFSVASYTH